MAWHQSGWRNDSRPQLPGRWRLHLVVEDDGVGIPETRLATLFEQGIGVSNVNERMKVLFGADYRMWIDSKPGEGTRTGIEIPDVMSPARSDRKSRPRVDRKPGPENARLDRPESWAQAFEFQEFSSPR